MKSVQKDVPILRMLAQSDKTFYIPVYQRNYSWKKEQIDILFSDIVKLITGEYDEHFFGTLYYFVESSGVFGNQNLVLIDGQQRLTTIMLFLIAIRDLTEDKEFKEKIERTYLLNDNIQEQNKIKLKQAAQDNIEYQRLIKQESGISSSHKVLDNYRIIKNHINKFLLDNYSADAQEGLMALLKGLNNLYLVLLELDPSIPAENPQVVFENINSIGLELTVNDLIRNYLLMGLGKEEQERLYERYWIPIEKNIGDIEKNTPLFVRHFLHMKQLKTVKQENKLIYRAYKDYFRSSKNVVNELALSELEKYSYYFSIIIGLREHESKEVSSLLYEVSQILKRNVSFCFLLKILSLNDERKLTNDQLASLIEIVISYSVRRTILNLGSGGSQDELFVSLTSFISKQNNYENIINDVYYYMSQRGYSQRFPNDDDLKEILKTRDFYSLTLRYYILEKTSNEITGSDAPIDFRNHQDIQYEHIMPQALTREEGNGYISQDDYDKYFESKLNTLSNGTLTDINQKLGNLPFEKKKELLINSSNLLISRKWITDKNKWDIKAMDERFEKIFPYVLKAFPYPLEYQKLERKEDTKMEYSLEEIFDSDLDLAPLKIISFNLNGKTYVVNSATKMYIEFLEFMIKEKSEIFEELCENENFKRVRSKFGGLFNFSKNKDNVTYGTIDDPSVKRLSNGVYVDTNYAKSELMKKMIDVSLFLGYYEKIIVHLTDE